MAQNLGEYIAAQVRTAINNALNDNQAQITEWFKDAGGNVNVNVGGATGSLVDILTGGILAALFTDPALVPVIAAATAAEDAAGGQGLGFGLGYWLASVGFTLAQPVIDIGVYAVNRATTEARLDAPTAASMWASGVMTAGEAQAEAADLGYDPNRVTQLYQQAITYPDVATLLEMNRRGLLLAGDLNLALDRHGYTIDYQQAIQGLQRNLLSPADLALAVLRGFMDLPTAEAYIQILGFTLDDFNTLIDNTGEPPGLEALLAMYRRNIIDEPTLQHGIRESRVRDEWIPAIEAYRFSPMSVADAIRARVENYLDDPTALTITSENGLDPTHYPYLVEAFGRPLSLEEMASLYHRGLASEDDVKQAIRESDIKDKYVDKGFELTRRLITERYIDLGVEFGAFTHDEAINDLMILGYDAADAELILDLGQQQHHRIQKDLTAADITASYIDRLMTEDQAKDALIRVGYKPDVAQAYLDLAEFKYHASLAKIAQTETKALFQKGDIDRDAAIDRLVKGGTPQNQATAIVDEWELIKGIPTKTLSESQIVKAAEYLIITPDDAHTRLKAIGYTAGDATILLQEAGLVKIQPVPQSGQPGGGPGGTG